MRKHRNHRGGPEGPTAFDITAHTDFVQQDSRAEESTHNFFRRSIDRKAEQKAKQLCRQVYRTLSYSLPGSSDPVLRELTLLAVDPVPDAGHLLVTVVAGAHDADGPSPIEVLARLDRASGRLRAEVARDIVRKRAPELTFRLLPRTEVSP